MQQRVSSIDGFVYTTAIKKLRKLKKRTRVIPGGSSAGKTFGILPLLIDEAIKTPLREISVVSESIPHLRKGALKDFLKIMKLTGRYIDENYNKTQLIYTFSNGSYIEFFSADQEDKVRGPRRHILYINECNNIKQFDTYYQLAIRTSDTIWLDFNPSGEFWAYTECKEDEDTEWLTLTYLDNEGLPDSIKREIEKSKTKGFIDPNGSIHDEKNIKNKFWANWWKVYGLGMLGSLEGIIFGNWEIIPDIPEGAKFIGSGLDFGYTNDPTAIPDVYTYGGKRVVDLRCYATGLLNTAIADVLLQHPVPPMVWCDSSEPKSKDEIKGKGLNIDCVFKGKDSIMYGVQIMQQQDYLITARSVELIKELRQYSWDTDRNGVKLNKPAGGFDHAIDALRYHEMMSLGKKKKRKAVFGWGNKTVEVEEEPTPQEVAEKIEEIIVESESFKTIEEVIAQVEEMDYDVSDLI